MGSRGCFDKYESRTRKSGLTMSVTRVTVPLPTLSIIMPNTIHGCKKRNIRPSPHPVYKAICDITIYFDYFVSSREQVIEPLVKNFVSGKIS